MVWAVVLVVVVICSGNGGRDEMGMVPVVLSGFLCVQLDSTGPGKSRIDTAH